MSYPRVIADALLDIFGECWLKKYSKVQYVAVIENPKKPATYTFEQGIYENPNDPDSFKAELTDTPPLDCIFSDDDLNYINSLSDSISFNKEESLDSNIKFVSKIKPQGLGDHLIRPLLSGCSVQGNYNDDAGALGVFLKLENTEDRIFMMSNYHVLSPKEMVKKNLIYQPTNKYYDHKNAVAELLFGSYPKEKESARNNTLDVAFASLLKKDIEYVSGFVNNFQEEEKPFLTDIKSPEDEMDVFIYGRSSRKGTGKIRSINTIVKVESAYTKGEDLIFKNQVLTGALSQKGDSGSVLINTEISSNTNNVVGLIHAGDGKNCSISNNIMHIFNREYDVEGYQMEIVFKEFLT